MSKQKSISSKSNCYKTNLTQISKLPYQLTTPTFSSSNCSRRSLVFRYSSSIIFLSCPKSKRKVSNPDEYSLVNSLKTAPPSRCSTHGQQIHSVVIKSGFCRFTVLMTALMDFNMKCGNLKEAEKVFDEMPETDVVSWTSMIVGYSKHHYYAESLSLFRTMISTGAITPSAYSFSGALAACSGLQALKQGQQIHAHVLTSGFLGVNLVLQNNLLNMYSRSQSIGNARKLFDLITKKGNIAWNEMISGCLQRGEGEEVLKLFTSMVSQGVKPDKFSYAICADACAELASMQQGIQIHAHTIKNGFQSDLVVGNALVDMYAKCGCVNYAKLIFDSIPSPDTFLWTTMISAYGKNGQVDEVLTLFELMLGSSAKPDEITFLTVLSACSHGGLIDQGQRYFRLMTEEHLIPAGPEHYSCMVDLLCRGGYLCEALEFIKKMPMKASISVWTAFLSSCRIYGNTKLAQFAADQFLEENPENQSDLLVLSNMYASGHDWNETEKIRERMRNDNVRKDPGCSWIELKNGIHVFLTGERSHPDIGEILLTLNALMGTCWKDMKNASLLTLLGGNDVRSNLPQPFFEILQGRRNCSFANVLAEALQTIKNPPNMVYSGSHPGFVIPETIGLDKDRISCREHIIQVLLLKKPEASKVHVIDIEDISSCTTGLGSNVAKNLRVAWLQLLGRLQERQPKLQPFLDSMFLKNDAITSFVEASQAIVVHVPDSFTILMCSTMFAHHF